MQEVAVLLNGGVLDNPLGNVSAYFKDINLKAVAGGLVGGIAVVSVPGLVGVSNPWARIVAELVGIAALTYAAHHWLGGAPAAAGVATIGGVIVASQLIEMLVGKRLLSVAGLGEALGGLGGLGGLNGLAGRLGGLGVDPSTQEIFGAGGVGRIGALEPTYDGVNSLA